MAGADQPDHPAYGMSADEAWVYYARVKRERREAKNQAYLTRTRHRKSKGKPTAGAEPKGAPKAVARAVAKAEAKARARPAAKR